jgi:Putative peptidoglycan binding domain
MRISILKIVPIGLLVMAVPAFASVHPKAGSSNHAHANVKDASAKHRKGLHLHAAREEKAPMEMPSERATEIQSALIKQGYLTGEPTGRWDDQSVSAMQRMQGENGWQTKITPDSRALIKLGLGPTDAGAAPVPGADTSSANGKSYSQDFVGTQPQP